MRLRSWTGSLVAGLPQQQKIGSASTPSCPTRRLLFLLYVNEIRWHLGTPNLQKSSKESQSTVPPWERHPWFFTLWVCLGDTFSWSISLTGFGNIFHSHVATSAGPWHLAASSKSGFGQQVSCGSTWPATDAEESHLAGGRGSWCTDAIFWM